MVASRGASPHPSLRMKTSQGVATSLQVRTNACAAGKEGARKTETMMARKRSPIPRLELPGRNRLALRGFNSEKGASWTG